MIWGKRKPRRGPLPAQGALSGVPIYLSPHQKDQISVSMLLGIFATTVEVASDCRGGMWGQIHIRDLSKLAVLCTFQYEVLVSRAFFYFVFDLLWRSCTRYKSRPFFHVGYVGSLLERWISPSMRGSKPNWNCRNRTYYFNDYIPILR